MGEYVQKLRTVFKKQKEELMGVIEFIVAEAIAEAAQNAAKSAGLNRYELPKCDGHSNVHKLMCINLEAADL